VQEARRGTQEKGDGEEQPKKISGTVSKKAVLTARKYVKEGVLRHRQSPAAKFVEIAGGEIDKEGDSLEKWRLSNNNGEEGSNRLPEQDEKGLGQHHHSIEKRKVLIFGGGSFWGKWFARQDSRGTLGRFCLWKSSGN